MAFRWGSLSVKSQSSTPSYHCTCTKNVFECRGSPPSFAFYSSFFSMDYKTLSKTSELPGPAVLNRFQRPRSYVVPVMHQILIFDIVALGPLPHSFIQGWRHLVCKCIFPKTMPQVIFPKFFRRQEDRHLAINVRPKARMSAGATGSPLSRSHLTE